MHKHFTALSPCKMLHKRKFYVHTDFQRLEATLVCSRYHELKTEVLLFDIIKHFIWAVLMFTVFTFNFSRSHRRNGWYWSGWCYWWYWCNRTARTCRCDWRLGSDR